MARHVLLTVPPRGGIWGPPTGLAGPRLAVCAAQLIVEWLWLLPGTLLPKLGPRLGQYTTDQLTLDAAQRIYQEIVADDVQAHRVVTWLCQLVHEHVAQTSDRVAIEHLVELFANALMQTEYENETAHMFMYFVIADLYDRSTGIQTHKVSI